MKAATMVVIVALPILAQSPKQPWTYSVEERIAMRTDPRLARERVAATTRLRAGSESRDPRVEQWVDNFDGKTHPELFLPHEVFDQLVKLAFLTSPRTSEVVRSGLLRDVERHGLPPEFWSRLRAITAVYVSDVSAIDAILAGKRTQSGAALTRSARQLALKYADACRSRIDAFQTARDEFGRERFDRFLYAVVAVGMFSSSDRLPDPDVLRQAERGCR